jgi:hypothetical protein
MSINPASSDQPTFHSGKNARPMPVSWFPNMRRNHA